MRAVPVEVRDMEVTIVVTPLIYRSPSRSLLFDYLKKTVFHLGFYLPAGRQATSVLYQVSSKSQTVSVSSFRRTQKKSTTVESEKNKPKP